MPHRALLLPPLPFGEILISLIDPKKGEWKAQACDNQSSGRYAILCRKMSRGHETISTDLYLRYSADVQRRVRTTHDNSCG